MITKGTMTRKQRAAKKRGDPDVTTLDERCLPGTVVAVFPNDYACRVRDDLGGANYDVAVPGLVQDSEGSGGEVYIPRVGQRVELKLGSGVRPRINGYLPQSFDAAVTSSETPPLFEHASEAVNTSGNAPNNFRGYMPPGLMAGDWCRLGNLGQHVGVFDGGVAVLQGSKLAQIRAVGAQGADTLSLFGRRMNIHTDFGDVIFGTEGGKSYVELLGGTDQTLESGVDRQDWTIRAAIGKGDGFANFAILDRTGTPVFKKVIEADGTISTTQAGANAAVFTGEQSTSYEKPFSRTVQSGDDSVTVSDGDRLETFGGNHLSSVQGSRQVTIMADDSLINGGGVFRSCKTYESHITGRAEAIPGDVAAAWKVANGDLNIDIGKPPSDLQKSFSSMNVTVYPANAKISMKALLGSVETFSSIETKIESAAMINLFAGGSLNAEAVGLMDLKAGGALKAKAEGVMQMSSTGPSMFGSSAATQLGGLGAVEPVVKGIQFLTGLSVFLGACSAAGKTAAGGGGSVPPLNGAGVIAIGAAADVLLALMLNMPSTKVFTE